LEIDVNFTHLEKGGFWGLGSQVYDIFFLLMGLRYNFFIA
jgi:hypothetical protein